MAVLDHLSETLLQELAASFPGQRVLGAWLFGSHARGEPRPGSDVDLAVRADGPLDPVALCDASGRLAAEIGAPVDLVDLRKAGGLLRVEATHHGRPLLPPTHEANLFTTHALADHAAFAPHRQAATRAFEEQLGVR